MNADTIYIGESVVRKNGKPVHGEIIIIDNEKYYKISNYDKMIPFLMNIVSDSDLWMFISSNGALTAGRKNPDNALFPYYTDDRIHDSQDITGNKTLMFVTKEDKSFLWEPFSSAYSGLYNTERTIYKNIAGNKLIFEEVNFDLSISYQYAWLNCDKFGFVKKSTIVNKGNKSVTISILDGIQNILPYGADRKFQLEYSTLLDGYKKNELLVNEGLGLYTLSSIPTDKAEPSEALKATTVWSVGFENSSILLSSKQVCSFRQDNPVVRENITKGTRGAYLIQSEFELSKGNKKEWYIIADVNKDQVDVAALSSSIRLRQNLKEQIESEILKSTTDLNLKVANADGFQLTNDPLITFRHFSNVTFNIMRGGLFDNNYLINKNDFVSFVKTANKILSQTHSIFLRSLPDQFPIMELIFKVGELNEPGLEKLCYEYLPLTFSRRHGDPSRPWNLFSIDIKDELGNKILNYQGNWRDIFQNWEALAFSFPGYIENMIVKFVNASTADGYNPYRITKDGFDWEVLNPSDVWSYIGYWGDHQVVYLLRLLELSSKIHPGILKSFLTKEIFAYANVPYKIKSYQDIVSNPHSTIEFDFKLDSEIWENVKEFGTDAKYIHDKTGKLYHINFAEKLLVTVLIKLSNFIPEAGIWMNTQRPEWNDANNALVGYGASMVTLYYLRRFIAFYIKLFREAEAEQIEISEEVLELFTGINNALLESRDLLANNISDVDRKRILDKLGQAGSTYRFKIYLEGFTGKKKSVPVSKFVLFLQLALDHIDHSIGANKREDDLYHSYNLVKINSNSISVRNLYEMLEGQVAILSSGYLSIEDSIVLISSLRKSKLFRKDQNSYLLYPERQLSRFTEKNIVPKELLEQSPVTIAVINKYNNHILVEDSNGDIHFNSKFKNAEQLRCVLKEQVNSHIPTKEEEELLLNIYESVFDHQSFTGRSGTFYKYEGLGCIYWHMVSKLLLAVQETYFKAFESDINISALEKLRNYYYEIREGLGTHKQPELYGAFPTDAYSHTPANMGVQQPGMTGQVKEDIISRFGELGLLIRDGEIHFNPGLLNRNEFLNKSHAFQYYDVNGIYQILMLNPGMLAYTICQVPVVYIISNESKIILTKSNDDEVEIIGFNIGTSMSNAIFNRDGSISKVKVLINLLSN